MSMIRLIDRVGTKSPQIVSCCFERRHLTTLHAVLHVLCNECVVLLTHSQVTLGKRALLDSVFDTPGTVRAVDVVGDPVPVEDTYTVRTHACVTCTYL